MIKENGTIAVHQFTLLVFFFGVGSTILISPSILATDAKQDAWMSEMLGTAFCLPMIALYLGLAKRYDRKSLLEINELVFGKWIGICLSLLYLLYFLILCAFLIGELGYFITTQVMPDTPIDFIMACLMAVVVMAVRLGPETFARGAEMFFPWVALLIVLLVLMLLSKVEADHLKPMLEDGIFPVVKAAYPYASYQEFIILMMVYPFLRKSRKGADAYYTGALSAGFVLLLIVLLCLSVLGPGLTSDNVYPSYMLAKKISIGHFLERVEVIVGGLWFVTITFKLILTFFAAAEGASQVFRFNGYRFMTVPLGMFIVASVLVVNPNIVYAMKFTHQIWPAFSITFMIAIPLLTWIVSRIRHGKAGEGASRAETGSS